ncbi:F-box protein SKIP23-like [Iris pallida]|uniref:F-box protein SKIP23-like n=1 Tax=Iris pallida TaxID=29817 RepID=A0AAX6G5K3_IRIPA|nr:F-box protein SKIP23-like [Iris pallida]KAJ6823637.1 F-box protein SKIP23-like [Iris pallida]
MERQCDATAPSIVPELSEDDTVNVIEPVVDGSCDDIIVGTGGGGGGGRGQGYLLDCNSRDIEGGEGGEVGSASSYGIEDVDVERVVAHGD